MIATQCPYLQCDRVTQSIRYKTRASFFFSSHKINAKRCFCRAYSNDEKTEKLFARINFVADKSVERQQKNSRSVEKENKKNAEIRRVQPTDHTATTEKQQQQQQQKKKGKIDILCTDKSYMHSGKTYIVLGEHSLSLYLSLRCITSAHENLAFGKTIETRLRIIRQSDTHIFHPLDVCKFYETNGFIAFQMLDSFVITA